MKAKTSPQETLKPKIDARRLSDIKFPYGKVTIIIASFALAILDMLFLYRAVHTLTGLSNIISMATAFILATVANINAALWGYQTGRNLENKSINRHSRGFFISWVLIGFVYLAIRGLNIYLTYNDLLSAGKAFTIKSISSELFQIAVLGISYIGTGTLISSMMSEIANKRLSDARKYEKRFGILHDELVAEAAGIQALMDVLKNSNKTYASLERQRREIKKGIIRSEKSAMSAIIGNIIQDNSGVSAKDVHAIMDEFLEKRNTEDEKDL